MHCPRCGHIYSEGSQRFCDLDGARLVSGDTKTARPIKQSVFSTILPIGEITPSSARKHEVQRENERSYKVENGFSDDEQDLFFEAEDADEMHFAPLDATETAGEPEIENELAVGRKIAPGEIPAGHIEIGHAGESDHPSVKDASFYVDDPEAFLGKMVKGRYQVVDMLGEDDTGYAFLGEDRLLDDKRVMIRILDIADVDEVTASIFAEERISLSHLNHPNVVRVIDSGEFTDGTPFLISEHIDGLNVADILHINGQMDMGRAARIIRQAGEALSEVHREGILHRDLRAEDVVVCRDDEEPETVKLSNFGVSDGSAKDENLAYKAPEILEGKVSTIASDIYSLGVIAYIMLTANLPFEYRTRKDLLEAENNGLNALPSSIRPELGPAIDQIFEKVLAPEPLLRYSTAREFGDALCVTLTAGPNADGDKKGIAYSSTRLSVTAARPLDTSRDHLNDSEQSAGNQDHKDSNAPEASWTRRSPEPPHEPARSWIKILVIAIGSLAVIAAGIWYYVLNRPQEPVFTVPPEQPAPTASIDPASQRPDGTIQIEVPPLPRQIPQPPNTDFFQNSRQNLKGDLLRNFVGFSLYYPKDWKSAGPQESITPSGRGKFLDISKNTRDDELREQLLISYFPSSGTYTTDAPRFPVLSHEANETLKKLIPNYQLVSEGEISVNNGWRAYEIRFQGSGVAANGERLLLWGRRLFIPASRPGVRSGFEITMLATSNADEVHSVDDVGNRGELAQIFATFEPSQNF